MADSEYAQQGAMRQRAPGEGAVVNRQFIVLDNATGQPPNLEQIALKEDWAKVLVYCDMDGFATMEDGSLILMDECGTYAYCPPDRFRVVWANGLEGAR
jgi:hypothetical protein